MKCEGTPYHECGRPTSGVEQWCFVHGDLEDRRARWEMEGKDKLDIDGPNAKRERLPTRPHELQGALL